MSGDSIRVVCRLRPLNKIQIANSGQECVNFTSKDVVINVGGDENKYNFTFDRVFGPNTQQIEIYKDVATPVIKSVIGGFNGTIFAYGQTGGGKTWTMQGPNHHDVEYKGLIPRTIQGLFESIAEGDENVQFVIKCSYIEIYNEKLFDLLDPSKARLEIKEDKHRGVFIQNCTEISVGSAEQMLKNMDNGSQNRKVAFTGMNQRSSRSHSLFIIHVNQKNVKKDSTKQSKLYFVDLAGSEKVGKTGCQGVQLQQAKNINKSLSSLGNVINALTSDKKQHIPYRDSKLTRILQQSLGGNSKTTLIINCSMCTYNDKETLSTLRFGYRAKSIKNKAKVNEEKSAKQLLILLDIANKTIADLKLQLGGGKMKVEIDQKQEEDDSRIEDLRNRLEESKRQDEQRQKQLKQMQLRIKSLLNELSSARDTHNTHIEFCSQIFKNLKGSLFKLNKYMSRVYVDLQYWITNLIVQGTQSEEIRTNMNTTFEAIMQFTSYYNKQVKQLFKELDEQKDTDSPAKVFQGQRERKKIKLIYSEPNLNPDQSHSLNEELQMSCIIEKKGENQSNTVVNSDKMSQEESFTQFQTLLESLETKQSQRTLMEQMSNNIKSLKRENEQLTKKNEKLTLQIKQIAKKIQERYEEQIMDLEERVQEYRNIIKQKDNELTNYLKQIQKQKNYLNNQKVIVERLKKVIESNGNLKNYYQMQERVRSLAQERQKLFNELYKLRNELDQAEMNVKQKQEHIESLKEVMKQLTSNRVEQAEPVLTGREIEKKYNSRVYGTQNPNVVVTVKGGTGQEIVKNKQSSLRKKVSNFVEKKQQKSSFLPFIKGFFG